MDVKLFHVDVGGRADVDAALDEVLELLDVISTIPNQCRRNQWVAGNVEGFGGVGLRLATDLSLNRERNRFRGLNPSAT